MKIRLTLRQLEIFRALADTLNFSEAAKAVHLSQPALSNAIRKMEELVEAPLVDRTTRSVKLTSVGQELLKVTTRLLHDLDDALEDVSALAQGKTGHLSVSAVPSLAATFFPEVLRRYQAKYPNVALQARDALSEASIQALKTGQVDIAIAPAKPHDDELVQHALFRDRLVLICRADHELAQFNRVTWSRLWPYRLVSLATTSNVRHILEAEYTQHGTAFQPAFEVEQASTLIGFIMNELGIGILPASLTPLLNFSGLKMVELGSPEIHRSICVMHLKSRALTPAAQNFLADCRELAHKYAQ
ncbi:LysR family transcriptional regulator [Bordetella sp. 15P40C-2]|uniref:LysR family transcriptional regulator n=1 Tax=Bordetella sp. 15P40C-2 TaxID=2572246 RepID=UPI00132BEC3C|nr:LysR family transcriptional regulator [Bordetella sp. 15P40C-2]